MFIVLVIVVLILVVLILVVLILVVLILVVLILILIPILIVLIFLLLLLLPNLKLHLPFVLSRPHHPQIPPQNNPRCNADQGADHSGPGLGLKAREGPRPAEGEDRPGPELLEKAQQQDREGQEVH